MELQNSFIVPSDIDTAWQTLLDVESIAPCMPGATLETFTGDSFTANVRIKLGPVIQNFKGEGEFTSKDEATHTAVIRATGKEMKGGGTATANITAKLTAVSAIETRADVVTDLTITGRVAQFGKGVIVDVSKVLIGQFSENLRQVILARTASKTNGGEPVAAPVIQTADSIDLLGSAGAPIVKRLIPVGIGLIVVVGVVWWLIAR
jgi:carbon monoxide dehydrogenase subunit G